MTYKLYKILALLILSLLLTSCGGGIAAIIGLGPTATTIVKGASAVKLGVDVGLAVAGEKSTNEQLLSAITKKDCLFLRILEDRDVCLDKVKEQELKWTTPK